MVSKKFQDINNEAGLKASEALSKLIDRPVIVEIIKAEEKKIEELNPLIGPEEMVAGVYLPVTGDLKGTSLLIFPQETACSLSDLLVGRQPGTTSKLNELDKSALKELGNIISGNYFTVLSNRLKAKIIENVPNFGFGMFGAILEQIISKFAQETKKALAIEIVLSIKQATLKGYFMLFFNIEEIEVIL